MCVGWNLLARQRAGPPAGGGTWLATAGLWEVHVQFGPGGKRTQLGAKGPALDMQSLPGPSTALDGGLRRCKGQQVSLLCDFALTRLLVWGPLPQLWPAQEACACLPHGPPHRHCPLPLQLIAFTSIYAQSRSCTR